MKPIMAVVLAIVQPKANEISFRIQNLTLLLKFFPAG